MKSLKFLILVSSLYCALGCGDAVIETSPRGQDTSATREYTSPQDALVRMVGQAHGFFQRYRSPVGEEALMMVVLMPRGEENCASLSNLDVAQTFRIEARLPAAVGLYQQSVDEESTRMLLVGPGYETGIFPTPGFIGVRELSEERISGGFGAQIPDDPLEHPICSEIESPSGSESQCTCISHADVSSTCHTERCCFASTDGAFDIAMPFEATACLSLCEGLQKRGYECLP